MTGESMAASWAQIKARDVLMATVSIDDDSVTEILAQALTAAYNSGVMEAKAALRPFADYADNLDKDAGGPFPDTSPIGYCPHYPVGARPNIGDARRARSVLTSAGACRYRCHS